MSTTQKPYRELIADTVAEISSPDALKRIYMLAGRLYRIEHNGQTVSGKVQQPDVTPHEQDSKRITELLPQLSEKDVRLVLALASSLDGIAKECS